MARKKSPAIWGDRADIWGNCGDLFQNHVDEGGHIAYVNFTVAVDVANCVGIVGEGEDFVNQRSHVAHIHHTITIDVALLVFGDCIIHSLEAIEVDGVFLTGF